MRTRMLPVLALLLAGGLSACDGPVASAPGAAEASPDEAGLHYVGEGSAAVPGASGARPFPLGAPTTLLDGGGVRAYTSEPEFVAAAPDLSVETFEDARVEPGAAEFCLGSFDASTDNDCFGPGGILDGLSLRAVDFDRLAVIRPGFLDIAETSVGPNNPGDPAEISFPDEPVAAVGFNVLAPMGGPSSVMVEVFAEGGESLGSTLVEIGGDTSLFWGMTSETPFARILVTPASDVGPLFEDIAFGTAGGEGEAAELEIEVRSGAINPGKRGVIPVAVFSTDDLDATTLDPNTIRFGPGEAAPAHDRTRSADLDGDGRPDLLVHFRATDAGLSCGDLEAVLVGETNDGASVRGRAPVRVLCIPGRATPRGGR